MAQKSNPFGAAATAVGTVGEVIRESPPRVSKGGVRADPFAIDEQDRWIFDNPEALAAVREGIRQVEACKLISKGSFAEYADIEID
ncbi:MAG: hypothetical protein ACLQVD_21455 [Capsulimonadaceae bacterium]